MSGGTFVAWWGAILGTVGTGLSIWNFWRDRPRIKVSVAKDIMLSENYLTDNPEEKFILITAANVGRHPVHLYKAYFTQRTATEALILTGPRNFGTEILNPGLKRDFPAIQSKLDLSNLKEAYVVDAIERKFKCKIPRSW
jgi:hypothetical protein